MARQGSSTATASFRCERHVPMGATAQALIREAASTLHRDVLKPLGFRKTGLTWIQDKPWARLIGLELDKWNTATNAKVRLAFGMFIPEFHVARQSPPIRGAPKVYQCSLRNGHAHDDADTRWQVDLATDPTDLAAAMADPIRQIALPWFEQMTSWSTVAGEFVQQNKFLDAFIAHALNGDRKSATSALAEALTRIHPSAHPFARATAKRLATPWPGD